MPKKPIDVDQYRRLVSQGKLMDPLIFLESLVQGNDLRNASMIFELVMEIDEDTGGDPGKDDWDEVVQVVRRYYKHESVKISASQRAAETLASYIHPKVKPDDGNSNNVGEQKLPELTEDEIIIFREKFNDEY